MMIKVTKLRKARRVRGTMRMIMVILMISTIIITMIKVTKLRKARRVRGTRPVTTQLATPTYSTEYSTYRTLVMVMIMMVLILMVIIISVGQMATPTYSTEYST